MKLIGRIRNIPQGTNIEDWCRYSTWLNERLDALPEATTKAYAEVDAALLRYYDEPSARDAFLKHSTGIVDVGIDILVTPEQAKAFEEVDTLRQAAIPLALLESCSVPRPYVEIVIDHEA